MNQKIIILLFIIIGLLSCNITAKDNSSSNDSTTSFFYPISINYSNPELYLNQGVQTNLSDSNFAEIQSKILFTIKDLNGIKLVYQWIKDNFSTYSAGGSTIGKIDVNTIFTDKKLGGCHDWALIMSSILRRFGYPVIIIDAAGIQWVSNYKNNLVTSFKGHVFIEVYLNDKWILVDSTTGQYVLEYDHNNPVIPITKSIENKGYYVLYKGLDSIDYGVTSNSVLTSRMKDFAQNLDKIIFNFPSYQISNFNLK